MASRDEAIASFNNEIFDCLIIGGGINGAVGAAALSAKGARVALIDKNDFAAETSSQSSNLAWGGIKYLESREFRLVNKLCKSRNLLMDSYPSTVKEIRFLTTIQKGFRFHPLFIYTGSLFYWLLGRFRTRAPQYLTKSSIKQREPAINVKESSGGLEYSDCYLYDNDSRFVFNFIKSALTNGASCANYVELISAHFDGELWHVELQDHLGNNKLVATANTILNACGPWVDELNQKIGIQTQHHHLFSKGVHLTVPKLTEDERVLAFFASDGRLFFVIPMGPTTCIGTTDTQVDHPEVQVTDSDRQFLLDNVNRCLALAKPLTQEDIIAERCGVRPLAVTSQTDCEDWVALSRKHEIDVDEQQKVLSIFGGKITDCINVGEQIAKTVESLGVNLGLSDEVWYGEPDRESRDEFMRRAKLIELDKLTPESSSEVLSTRLWRRYGAEAFKMLDEIQSDRSQAKLLIENAEYLRCEIHHAAKFEMVSKLEDFLRRRSKIAMVVNRKTIENSEGLRQACQILFGQQWQKKLDEYLSLPHS